MTIHALSIFLSFVAFFVAVLTGLFFLAQEDRLKRKDPAALQGGGLPLELLDRINLAAVVVGFFLFSFGMLQGGVLSRQQWGAFLTKDTRQWLSLLTWGAYAGVLALRLRVGLRGRRVVLMSVMSFVLVLFTFLIQHSWTLQS